MLLADGGSLSFARGRPGRSAGLLLAGGKVLTDMGAADLGADLAELRWPDTMPDAASEAGDESGEICLRAGRCCGGRRARLPGRPHGW